MSEVKLDSLPVDSYPSNSIVDPSFDPDVSPHIVLLPKTFQISFPNMTLRKNRIPYSDLLPEVALFDFILLARTEVPGLPEFAQLCKLAGMPFRSAGIQNMPRIGTWFFRMREYLNGVMKDWV